MNNFLKNLRFYQTNQRALVMEPFSFEDSFTELRHRDEYVIYELSAKIGDRVTISENMAAKAKALIEQRLTESLNEHVHGGYRLPLLDLRRHLIKRGDREGIELVDKILEEMFKV